MVELQLTIDDVPAVRDQSLHHSEDQTLVAYLVQICLAPHSPSYQSNSISTCIHDWQYCHRLDKTPFHPQEKEKISHYLHFTRQPISATFSLIKSISWPSWIILLRYTTTTLRQHQHAAIGDIANAVIGDIGNPQVAISPTTCSDGPIFGSHFLGDP